MQGIYNRNGSLRIDHAAGALPTYYSSGAGYTAYATPTDMLTLSGSDTKVIRIYNMRMQVHTTAAALQSIQVIKRSTANSGGTSSTPSIFPVDSGLPAATGVVRLYTAAPAGLGTAVGTGYNFVLSATPTSVPGLVQSGSPFPIHFADSFPTPIILRGSNESLCLNYAGAALTAGFTAWWDVLWTESSD